MKSVNIAALTALLSAAAHAQPMIGHNHAKNIHARLHHAKRDVVWETVIDVEVVTVYKTVYDDGSEPTSTREAATTTHANKYTTSDVVVTSTTSAASVASSPAETSTSTSAAVSTATQSVSTPSATSAAASSSSAAASIVATSTYAAIPATTTTAAASSTATSTASGTYTGDFTYYEPGLGACGYTNTDAEDIVAISHLLFDQYTPGTSSNANTLCGTYVTMNGKDGVAYKAKIVDRCVGCALGDLDMTEELFNKATSNGDGRVTGMTWTLG